jgi:cobalt-zinc-cadmium efflux system outer membrane protein
MREWRMRLPVGGAVVRGVVPMKSLQHCCAVPLLASIAGLCAGLPNLAMALSFSQALQLAEHNAPSLVAQAAKLEAAQYAAIPAGELPDPKLLFGLQNVPFEGSRSFQLNAEPMTMQMLGVSQQIPNSDKRQARRDSAAAAIDSAAAASVVERLQVRLQTAQAWIASYTLQHKLVQFEAFAQQNRLFAATVKAQLAGGGGQAADVIGPQQEAALLAEEQDQLRQQYQQAQAALSRWIGDEGLQPLSGQLPQWPFDPRGYFARQAQHPQVAAYAPLTREAEALVRQAQAEKNSDWSWEVDYQKRGADYGDMFSVKFSVDLPLFTASRQTPKIAARLAEVNQLQAQQQTAVREQEQLLRDQLAQYQRLQRAVARSQSSLIPLAEDKLRLTQASYGAGKTALTTVIDARRELIANQLKQLDLQGQLALTSTWLQFNYAEQRP